MPLFHSERAGNERAIRQAQATAKNIDRNAKTPLKLCPGRRLTHHSCNRRTLSRYR